MVSTGKVGNRSVSGGLRSFIFTPAGRFTGSRGANVDYIKRCISYPFQAILPDNKIYLDTDSTLVRENKFRLDGKDHALLKDNIMPGC